MELKHHREVMRETLIVSKSSFPHILGLSKLGRSQPPNLPPPPSFLHIPLPGTLPSHFSSLVFTYAFAHHGSVCEAKRSKAKQSEAKRSKAKQRKAIYQLITTRSKAKEQKKKANKQHSTNLSHTQTDLQILELPASATAPSLSPRCPAMGVAMGGRALRLGDAISRSHFG